MSATVLELTESAFAALMRQDMPAFFEVFADDVEVELPFAPEGWPKRLHGRAGLIEHLQNFPQHLTIQQMTDLTVHQTLDPKVIIVEYALAGVVTASGAPYEVRYLQVVTAERGKIVRYRDYWNPLLALALAPEGFNEQGP